MDYVGSSQHVFVKFLGLYRNSSWKCERVGRVDNYLLIVELLAYLLISNQHSFLLLTIETIYQTESQINELSMSIAVS